MNKKALLAILTGSIIAGSSGLLIKSIHLPGASLAFLRMAIPALVLGTWMAVSGIRFFRGRIRPLLWASALNAVRMYLFIVAYQMTTVSNTIIMLFTWPIFVNVLSSIILKEKISVRQILLLLLAFSGILVIFSGEGFSFSNIHFLGMLAALFSAVFFSVSYVIFKRVIHQYHRNEIIFYQNILGAVIFLPVFLYINAWPVPLEWPLVSIYGLLMGVVIFHFFLYGLKHMDASKASLLQYIEIVSALAIGVIFLDETLTWRIICGALLIISAITIMQRSK